MADYRVDPDGVTGVASALSAAADSGPSASIPSAHGCGSPVVTSLLDDDGVSLAAAWRSAVDAVMSLSVGGVKAADAYRETESGVASASKGGPTP